MEKAAILSKLLSPLFDNMLVMIARTSIGITGCATTSHWWTFPLRAVVTTSAVAVMLAPSFSEPQNLTDRQYCSIGLHRPLGLPYIAS